MVSLPFQALVPRGRTHEQDQPPQPATQHIRPQFSDPSSTPLPKPFPAEFVKSNFLSFRGQKELQSWCEGHSQIRKWPFH